MTLHEKVQKSLQEFRTLTGAVIDSSSILYMNKANFLEILSTEINLSAPSQVKHEIDSDLKKINFFDFNNERGLDTDDIIVISAYEKNLPVISDDKYILKYALEKNLPYFNSVMMLIFLFFCNKISLEELRSYQEKLYSFAYYSKQITNYAENILNIIIDSKQ